MHRDGADVEPEAYLHLGIFFKQNNMRLQSLRKCPCAVGVLNLSFIGFMVNPSPLGRRLLI